MDEFKKPCLPPVPVKIVKPVTNLLKPKEDIEKFDVPPNIQTPVKIAKEATVLNKSKEDSDTFDVPANTQTTAQQCPYKVPQWSEKPSDENNYNFEVLKSGQIIEEIKKLQNKAYWTFGRLPENDIEMAHPTISRFHAILQYRPKSTKAEEENGEDNTEDLVKTEPPPEGWYLYDLGSTHGTFLNKQRIPPKVYIRIRVGHILRLGASTRSYILQGPSEDEESESELSVTDLKAKRQQKLEEAAFEKKRLAEESIERAKNEGCSWGMAEDADEESDLTHNPYASTNNEELFLNDPKKTLRGYFEREGLELVYKCDEMSAGSFVCRVELPIDDANGRSIVAEVVHKGKKKDCVVQCALEACRLLDRHGVLRQANQEPLKRKQKSQGCDSDDDEFWDRTGDVARKKQRKANANTSVTLTYDDLLKQENEIDEQIKKVESSINKYQEQQQRLKAQKSDEGEDLEAFMENLQEKVVKLDKTEIRKLRLEEQRLKTEKQRVQRLIKIAKPVHLPFTSQTASDIKTHPDGQNTNKRQLPMIGKRNQFSKFKVVKLEKTTKPKEVTPAKIFGSDEEEMEENENNYKEIPKSDILLGTGTRKEKNKNIETFKEKEHKIEKKCEKNPMTVKESESDICFAQMKDDKYEESSEKHTQVLPEKVESIGAELGNSNKKRRNRIRQRVKRQEVDKDDVEYESSAKYSKWLPPENQTGDGFTELNEKFGY